MANNYDFIFTHDGRDFRNLFSVKLDVVLTPGNGCFEIMDGDQLAASGKITVVEDDKPFFYSDLQKIQTSDVAERIELDTEDAYKEFLLRGYEYGPAFRFVVLLYTYNLWLFR